MAREVSDELAPTPTVVVDRPLHDKGVAWLRSKKAPRASLVDAVSFVVMGEPGIEFAFLRWRLRDRRVPPVPPLTRGYAGCCCVTQWMEP
jgi:hypothetical protein